MSTIANEWQDLPFSEAVLVNPTTSLERGKVYPFVEMSAITAGTRDVKCSEQREFSGGGSKFRDRDTLMARITPCLENGKIARFQAPESQPVGHGSTEFIVIRGRPDVSDNDFAYYLTISPEVRHFAISQMTGSSGRQRVPTDAFDAISIPLPPLDEQKAIAAVLGALDDKIELNRRMNVTLEAMAQTLFKNWFVDAAAEQLPAGWREATFGEHLEVAKGLSYKGSGLADAGVPLHNLNSVYEGGRYKHEGLKHYTGEYAERHIVHPGDVIVANTEQGHDYLLIGFPAIVPKCYGKFGLFTHHIYRVRPLAGSSLTNHFIYLALLTPAIRNQVIGHTNGTTVNALSKTGIEAAVFPLPPAELIAKFEKIVAPIFDQQELLHEESKKLSRLRDTLLPKLLIGELSVAALTRQPD